MTYSYCNDNHSHLSNKSTVSEAMITNEEKRTIEIESSIIESDKLLGQKKELTIQHKEEIYRLRLTGNDKLILTK